MSFLKYMYEGAKLLQIAKTINATARMFEFHDYQLVMVYIFATWCEY